MTTVGELCNRTVVITSPDTPVREAARLMRTHHVGDLVVVERADGGSPAPIGIATDRDLVLKVMAVGVEPDELTLEMVMSTDLVTSHEAEDPATVLKRMRGAGVRRMPIIDDDGALAGIITYDDLIEWLAEQLGDLIGVARVEQERERAQ